MSEVLVAVPVLRGKRRFHIDKGRPWSVVEHLILSALANRPMTVSELAEASELPRRVIIEILIRLMRVGWIQMSEQRSKVSFQASQAGTAVAGQNELPALPKRINRWMSFLIDRVTGAVFRSRDLTVVHFNDVVSRARTDRLVWLEPRNVAGADDIRTVANVLLDEDERLAFVETSGDRLVERYALISVRGRVIERSLRLPDGLETAILDAAAEAPPAPAGDRSPKRRIDEHIPLRRWAPQALRSAAISSDDLVLGGEAHRELFQDTVRRARRHLIVHSCFVTRAAFNEVRELLLEAARRDVKVDLLWGEDPEKPGNRPTAEVVTALRRDPELLKLPNMRLHPFSTRSHGKFIIADDPVTGRLVAILGSCNWLSSRFDSVDASLRLRDPMIVSDLLYLLAELVKGAGGSWTALAMELAALGSQAAQATSPAVQRAQAQLIVGPIHADFVRKARDEARHRLFVVSHRLSEVANAAVIVPAMVAAQRRQVQVDLFYGRQSGAVDDAAIAALRQLSQTGGINLAPVVDPRLHAKVLAWDDDHALLTSQNWLSGDPNWNNPGQEVGIYVHAPKIAAHLVQRIEEALADAGAVPEGDKQA